MYHMMVITLTKKICGGVSTYNAGVGKPNCHNDTVVCMIQDGQAFSLANYTKNTINAPSNDEEAEMWIVRNGKGCPDLAGENLNSIINFKCSKPLVSTNLIIFFMSGLHCEFTTISVFWGLIWDRDLAPVPIGDFLIFSQFLTQNSQS